MSPAPEPDREPGARGLGPFYYILKAVMLAAALAIWARRHA